MDGGFTKSRGGLAPMLLALLRCPCCWGGGLADEGASLDCRDCGCSFPVRGGVPVLMPDVVAADGAMPDWQETRSIMEGAGLPPTPVALLRTRQICATQLRSLPRHTPRGSGLLIAWGAERLPRALRPGVEMVAAIRLRNDGSATLASQGAGRVSLAACWECLEGRPAGQTRTAVPVDLEPGRTITAPLLLRAPAEPGRYALSVHAVQEEVRWLIPPAGPFLVHVRSDAVAAALPDRCGDGGFGRWLAQRGPCRVALLGDAPAPDGCAAVRIGADLQALQLGLLRGDAAPAVCIGGDELPLAPAAFDAVIGAGALRFSADPVRLLLSLRRLLRPGGCILLADERTAPEGGEPYEPDMQQAWRRGLDPQRFTQGELASFARRAGLLIVAWAAEGGAVTMRLEPECADA
jgi:SAM-dependent methyltransferase/uncharacterized protein YbaR (Trm112 family)